MGMSSEGRTEACIPEALDIGRGRLPVVPSSALASFYQP